MKARVTLKVHPGARKTVLAGNKLSVAAPPVDGKANDAVIEFVASLVRRPKSSVRIVTGFTSRTKIVEADGIAQETLDRAILEANEPRSHSGSAPPGGQ